MTRDEFTTEFTRAIRFVLQKHERETEARADQRSEGGAGWNQRVDAALAAANTNLDAAIGQLADHVYDALEQSERHPEDAHAH